jgi:hypothetical protein
MGGAQFGIHDPISGYRGFIKTSFTKALSINGLIFPTVQALKFDEINLEFFVQGLVHVQKIGVKD